MTARILRRSIAVVAVVALCPTLLRAQNASESRTDARPTLSLGADYSYQTFNGSIDPWQLAALSLTRRTTRGALIARVNYAGRFGSSGGQFEVDAYPRLTKSAYAYLNLGYSK